MGIATSRCKQQLIQVIRSSNRSFQAEIKRLFAARNDSKQTKINSVKTFENHKKFDEIYISRNKETENKN